MENSVNTNTDHNVVYMDFKNKKKLNKPTPKNNSPKTKSQEPNSGISGNVTHLSDILCADEYIDMSVNNAYASLLMSLEEDGWDSEHFRILEYVNEKTEELKYVLKFVYKMEKYKK